MDVERERSDLRIGCWVAGVVGTLAFTMLLWVAGPPSFFQMALGMLLLLADVAVMGVALLLGAIRWRKASRLWFAPSGICLVALVCVYFFVPTLNRKITDNMFRNQVAEYTRVVEAIQSGKLSCASPCEADEVASTGARLPHYLRGVRAERCDDGGIEVLFMFRMGGFVPFHSGYLFKGYGANSSCDTGTMRPEKRWPSMEHVTGQWYRFSD